MIEWLVALSVTTLLFMGLTVVLVSRCVSQGAEITRLEAKCTVLKESLFAVRTELEREIKKDSANQYEQQITSLKLALHLKQEKMDELQAKLKEQRVLLQQKWDGSKKKTHA